MIRAIKYDGSLVHGKMDGQGTLTFKMAISTKEISKMESLAGKFTSRAVGSTKVEFSKGQARIGQGTPNNRAKVTQGKFKQGIYQNAH